MMVRNEANIIATSLGHLLDTLRVERVYVTDNGSTDDTVAILSRIAAATGRVEIASEPGDYHQDVVMTGLARRAAADGADWILPADADEFLWLPAGIGLDDLARHDGHGGYRVPVCNFLQARPVRRDAPGALRTMLVSAVPHGTPADGQDAVGQGRIPFVRIAYPTKLFLRAAPDLRIAFGHHDAQATAGPLVMLPRGELLHAPMRAFSSLAQRAETGRRTAIVTPGASQNWHLKRLVGMDPAALEAEWRLNAYAPLHPVRPGRTRLDLRLARIAWRQAGFRRRYQRAT